MNCQAPLLTTLEYGARATRLCRPEQPSLSVPRSGSPTPRFRPGLSNRCPEPPQRNGAPDSPANRPANSPDHEFPADPPKGPGQPKCWTDKVNGIEHVHFS